MLKISFAQQGAALDKRQKKAVMAAAKAALKLEEKTGKLRVSFLVTRDEQIRRLNEKYRQIDKATDVLSFPSGERVFLGDIAISLERAKEQAKEYNHSVEREIAFLTAHSMLHLMGYDHQTREEEEVMRSKQREILREAGYSIQ